MGQKRPEPRMWQVGEAAQFIYCCRAPLRACTLLAHSSLFS